MFYIVYKSEIREWIACRIDKNVPLNERDILLCSGVVAICLNRIEIKTITKDEKFTVLRWLKKDNGCSNCGYFRDDTCMGCWNSPTQCNCDVPFI